MASPVSVVLGKNICKLRTELGMTQEALAVSMGMNRSYINRIEAGRARPSPHTIAGIVLALKVTANVIFAGGPGNLPEWRLLKGKDSDR
jgi:transcriptional regulator with XRE-family HTH domain